MRITIDGQQRDLAIFSHWRVRDTAEAAIRGMSDQITSAASQALEDVTAGRWPEDITEHTTKNAALVVFRAVMETAEKTRTAALEAVERATEAEENA